MQLSRRFAGLLSSSALQSRKWENLWRAPALQSSMSTDSTRKASSRKNTRAASAPRVSTAAVDSSSSEDDPPHVSVKPAEVAPVKPVAEDPVKPVAAAQELPKPGQIPWQTKVANSVSLIGHLGAPIKLGVSSTGVQTAVSVLVSKKTLDLPEFWIPIVFRGELAHIAACNLRENDHVYVAGQLTGQPEPVDDDAQSKIQVLVDNISYVLELSAGKEREKISDILDDFSAKKEDDPSITQKWQSFFQNPERWGDSRSRDHNKYGTFKHKDSHQILEVNESTPGWVASKLNSLTCTASNSFSEKNCGGSAKANCWSDLLENPEQWQDNREGKKSGRLNPKSPDFRHATTKTALWLDSAPSWVLSKLETVGTSPIRAHVLTYEEKWKDLLENPGYWWDNRLNKTKPTQPDFKHKVTGDVLWLDPVTTPSWAHAKLTSPVS